MTRSRRDVLGVGAVLLVVAVGIGLAGFAAGGGDGDGSLLVVRGTVGSEKGRFLDDPSVQEILADRFGLRIEYATRGSIEMLADPPGDQDFLWPAIQIGDEASYDPDPNSVEVYYSPIVLYSWAPVADALGAAGLVQQIDGTYYVTDFARLVEMIDAGTPWEELGLAEIPGPISIETTDPTTSNSGNSFAGLLANTYNGGAVVNGATIGGVLEPVQAFYARLGPLERRSADLFNRYVDEGMGAYPIIAGYESQLTEPSRENQDRFDQIREEVRILYPRPTVVSAHPLIALTPGGERLQSALLDDELQRLGWERHGFRSDLLGIRDDPTLLGVGGVPSPIDSVMPLPRAGVMERITAALRSVVPEQPVSTGTPVAALPSRTAPRASPVAAPASAFRAAA